jgi:hypothetical protein
MSNRELLFQWEKPLKKYKVELINISFRIDLFASWHSWINAEFALSDNHSLTTYSLHNRHYFYPRTEFVLVSKHYEYPTKLFCLVQSRPHHHLIEN